MKRTKFLKCEPCNTPKKISKDRVVATSQILEIDGERAVEMMETRRKDHLSKVWSISNSKQQTAGKDEDSPGCYITEIRQAVGGTPIQSSMQMDSRRKRNTAV